jgi:hypothetical protein
MIKELIKLATHLDERGLVKEADYLDAVIKKIAFTGETKFPGDSPLYENKGPQDWKALEAKWDSELMDGVQSMAHRKINAAGHALKATNPSWLKAVFFVNNWGHVVANAEAKDWMVEDAMAKAGMTNRNKEKLIDSQSDSALWTYET